MSPAIGSGGFSRNSVMRPSASVATRPNARASSTRCSAIVTAAPRDRWLASIAVRSRSVRMSPFSARKGSSPRRSSTLTIAPPVPSGSRSVTQVIVGRHPSREEGMERLLEVGRRHDHLTDAVRDEMIEDVVEDRPIDERQERLRHRLRQRSEPRSLTADQDDRLHRGSRPPGSHAWRVCATRMIPRMMHATPA